MKKNSISHFLYIPAFVGVFFLFLGCNNSDKKDTTFFGGKIKNPKGKYVYLYEGKKVLDSAKLNAKNKFLFAFDSIKMNLYTFKHGAEFQYLYLEPKDSLLIYLNTWDFDESLIFSGKGSAKNNYLINLYLDQEKTKRNFKKNYTLNDSTFSKIINKEIKVKLDTYNQLFKEEETSLLFDELAKTGIYFPYYSFKEYYLFNHVWQLKLCENPVLRDDFYQYQENIDLNNAALLNYNPYTSFIKTHLYRLAYAEKNQFAEKSNAELNYMELVNEKIQIQSFKNELLAGSLWKSISNEYLSKKEYTDLQEFFFTNCTDIMLQKELKKSIEQKEKLKNGDHLPLLIATNLKGNNVAINDFIKNNASVIYFWPKDISRRELLNTKLISLQRKYPQILFIGIERNISTKDWKKFTSIHKLEKNNQFYLPKTSKVYNLFEGDMARTLIINKKGYIQSAYLFFNNSSFNKQLTYFKKL